MIPTYAIRVADDFHRFYHDVRVLDSDRGVGGVPARALLPRDPARDRALSLDLVGVEAPERMWQAPPPTVLPRVRRLSTAADVRLAATDCARVGMLTGGGDCPGLNPVIRAVCRRLWEDGHETFGVLNGWRGAIDGDLKPLDFDETSGILHKGGTIIGTSRTNPFKSEGGVDGVKKTFEQIDALVAIGGEDTLGVAAALCRRGEPPRRRRPEDDRQRPQRHRLHLRLRHGRRGRDRRDRPLPLDGRVAQPDHRRRDDGPARRLDRADERASPAAPTTSSSPSSRSTTTPSPPRSSAARRAARTSR